MLKNKSTSKERMKTRHSFHQKFRLLRKAPISDFSVHQTS